MLFIIVWCLKVRYVVFVSCCILGGKIRVGKLLFLMNRGGVVVFVGWVW